MYLHILENGSNYFNEGPIFSKTNLKEEFYHFKRINKMLTAKRIIHKSKPITLF